MPVLVLETEEYMLNLGYTGPFNEGRKHMTVIFMDLRSRIGTLRDDILPFEMAPAN